MTEIAEESSSPGDAGRPKDETHYCGMTNHKGQLKNYFTLLLCCKIVVSQTKQLTSYKTYEDDTLYEIL